MAVRLPLVVDDGNTQAEVPSGDALMDYVNPDTATLPDLIAEMISRRIMAGPPPAVPVNTVAPAVTGTPTVGSTLSLSNGTWTGSPTSYAYQWQEDIASVWTNISGATSNTYVTDHAGTYRGVVVATNAFGDSDPANSNSVVVTEGGTMPAVAIQFIGDTDRASTTTGVGGGVSPFTIEALVYIETGSRDDFAGILSNRMASGRQATVATNNAFGSWPICVSNNQGGAGATVAFSPDASSGTWYLMTLAGDSGEGLAGTFRATYQEVAESSTLVTVSTHKGEFFSTPVSNGIAIASTPDLFGWPSGIRFQWVRAYASYRSTTEIEADLMNDDPTGAVFWWEFSESGGSPTATDLTGNGILPTIVGGTIVDGPGA